MVKPILDFFQVHREMILRDSPIVIKNMFGKTPKAFNAVDVIPCATINERLGVIDLMMLAISFQRLIAAKAISVINRTFSGLGADVLHQLRCADRLDDFGVNTPFALKQPENEALTGSTAPSLSFAATTEVSFIQL